MLLSDCFYNGMVRWQFWFDNPNKAAVLAVELALVGLALMVSLRRFVRVTGVVFAVGSLYVLLHTFSRGGIVALAVAVVPLTLRILQFLKNARAFVKVSLLIAAMGFCLLSVRMGVADRLAHGFSGKDRSVDNRFDLWRVAPRMLCDAPFGWGLGKSGEAYMQWYQPLERNERYRTLVNSHLTWIVETGIVGGVVWLLGWGVAMAFGFIVGRRHGDWLCLSEWVAFFVAALFSSVCESLVLWIIPMVVIGGALVENRHLIKSVLFCVAKLMVCIGCVAGVVIGLLDKDVDPVIAKHDYGIQVGRTRPLFWLVPDSSVLGGETYPREIRNALCVQKNVSLVIVMNARYIPANAEVVVICGAADDAGRRGQRKTIWLSPKRTDIQASENQMVVVGALSSVSYGLGIGVMQIEGASDYIPNWMSMLVDLSLGGR